MALDGTELRVNYGRTGLWNDGVSSICETGGSVASGVKERVFPRQGKRTAGQWIPLFKTRSFGW